MNSCYFSREFPSMDGFNRQHPFSTRVMGLVAATNWGLRQELEPGCPISAIMKIILGDLFL